MQIVRGSIASNVKIALSFAERKKDRNQFTIRLKVRKSNIINIEVKRVHLHLFTKKINIFEKFWHFNMKSDVNYTARFGFRRR